MPDGYGFRWRGVYALSLTTGGDSATARHDLFLGLVGADTHGHLVYQLSSAPQQTTRLKDQGQHVSPHQPLRSMSTQPVLRGRAVWVPERRAIETTLAEIRPNSVVSTIPVTSTRRASMRLPEMLDLAVPESATYFDFEIAATLDVAAPSSSTSPVLRFGGDSPLGLRIHITGWGSSSSAV